MKRVLAVSLLVLALSACTEDVQIGEKTKTGAVVGGALGAGLGAIVGSQVGDTGAGLVLGGAAGAAAGAAIGDSEDAREAELDRQEAKLKRQQAEIDSQRRKLDELRRRNQSSDVRASVSRGVYERSAATSTYREVEPVRKIETRELPVAVAPAIRDEVPITETVAVEDRVNKPSSIFGPANTGSLWQADEAKVGETAVADKKIEKDSATIETTKTEEETLGAIEETAALAPADTTSSTECTQAEKEIYNASNTSDTSSKLVHYRRALRLCPTNAQYHVSLGDLYRSLNRTSDAKYEYNEALKIDPSLSEVKDKVTRLEGGGSTGERY